MIIALYRWKIIYIEATIELAIGSDNTGEVAYYNKMKKRDGKGRITNAIIPTIVWYIVSSLRLSSNVKRGVR